MTKTGPLKHERKSLIRIADVLKAGEMLSTKDSGILHYVFPGLAIVSSSLPARIQGGDLHGIIGLDESRTALFIGDVAGHDFSSSILATEIIQYFDDYRKEISQPGAFIEVMADRLYNSMVKAGRFFTTAICLIDKDNEKFYYSSAGHPLSLFIRNGNHSIEYIGTRMLPVGFERKLTLSVVEHSFQRGDSILMFTDGISSGRNKLKQEFGLSEIESILSDPWENPSDAVHAIIEKHREFCEDGPEPDDCTLILAYRYE